MNLITVAAAAEYEFTEKKSRFIGYIYPVNSEQEALDKIAELHKEHKTATHIVYAFSIGDNIQRSTDDGEPSGTAGRPVLEVIKNAGINNVIVLVVRYFGGTLLGTGGLVRAYTQSAQGAVSAAGKAEIITAQKLLLSIPYNAIADINYRLENLNAEVLKREFAEKAMLTVNIADNDIDKLLPALKQLEGDYYHLEESSIRKML